MRIYNTTLNPDIWKNAIELRSEIRVKLLQITNDFYKDSGLTIPIKDIILIGSNANYNWTNVSDLDVHILIDFSLLNMEPDAAKNYTNLIKGKWNTEHNIKIKTYNVEMYLQDVSAKNAATGIFSILNNTWIVKPEKQSVSLDNELIKKTYQEFVVRIKSAINDQNLESIKNILKDVYDFRQSGLDRAGEFSTENVVFKLLRSKNYLDTLRTLAIDLYDKQVSV